MMKLVQLKRWVKVLSIYLLCRLQYGFKILSAARYISYMLLYTKKFVKVWRNDVTDKTLNLQLIAC